jgi:hypothetical protein
VRQRGEPGSRRGGLHRDRDCGGRHAATVPVRPQEHLVQRGLGQLDRLRGESCAVQPGGALGQRPGAVSDVQHDLEAVEVQVDAHVVEHDGSGPRVGGRRQAQREPGRTEPGLQLTGRPAGLHPPPVHDDDVVGQLIGLLEVLRGQQQRRAVPHQPPQHVPQLEACCAGRARSSARRGTGPRAG